MPQVKTTFGTSPTNSHDSSGAGGWLEMRHLAIDMAAGGEDHLLMAGFADDGRPLDAQQVEALFRLPGTARRLVLVDGGTREALDRAIGAAHADILELFDDHLWQWIYQEEEKLDG